METEMIFEQSAGQKKTSTSYPALNAMSPMKRHRGLYEMGRATNGHVVFPEGVRT